MTRLLFETLDEVRARVVGASHVLLGLDYDGTLTSIVDHPATADLPDDMKRVLQALAACARVTVAVVSGRERSDLLARVDVPDLIYAGNHGLEISGRGLFFVEPAAATHSPALRNLAEDLAERLQSIDGAQVEDKGLTLSVHFRRVPEANHADVRRITDLALDTAPHPFVLRTGDKIHEIRPRVPWDKGSAMFWIKEQLGQPNTLVIYLGDDATDEDAFAALPDEITVRIGGGETKARYRLEGPVEVQRFLEWLGREIKSPVPV